MGWVGGGLQYDKKVTSSSAKSLSVRTSVTILFEEKYSSKLSQRNILPSWKLHASILVSSWSSAGLVSGSGVGSGSDSGS